MSFGFGFGMPAGGNTVWSPASLFASGAPGAWYDPTDLTTLFQDAAGTTPVTAVEQPVGLMRDKSGNGNHATSLTTSRPVLTARVNLLTKTEQFDDAVWAKSNATVTANAVTAPDGKLTADSIARNSSGDTNIHNATATTVAVSTLYTSSVYLKQNTARYAVVQMVGGSSGAYYYVDLQSGVITQAVATYGASPPTSLTATVASVGNGWMRCFLSFTASSSSFELWFKPITSSTGPGYELNDPIGTSIYAWGASLTTADQASLGYQRVNTATDYDTVGFPLWLKADGVDDYMVTGTLAAPVNLNMSSTDKVTVATGVRKLSDAAAGIVIELSASYAVNAGTFGVLAPSGPALANYGMVSGGTNRQGAFPSGYAAPISNVLTGLGDISGDSAILRVNGAQAASNTSDQGTGNYGSYPLYLFRRAGTSLPFNGLFAGAVIVGRTLDAAELAQVETYYQNKTKAY